ncbi:MAG: glycosyltransferase family 4 protein [Opitutaceae bacterium]
MRVMLVISSMVTGGAQRVMSLLANRWATQDWEITLATLSATAADFYPLHAAIRRVGFGLEVESTGPLNALANNRARLSALRRLITESRPQVIVSFQDRMNVLTLLAARGTGVPVVVSERVDPRVHAIGKLWNVLRRRTYPWASRVVAQTSSVAEWLQHLVAREKIAVLSNPVEISNAAADGNLRESIGLKQSARIVLGAGRLVPQKGFDLLVDAFAQASRDRGEWHLVILGNGPERDRLTTLAARHQVEYRVHLPGIMQELRRYLEHVDLFVLSSRYEGFPNALLEAMAAGVAVIACDCASGPRDIVNSGSDGVLVAPENATLLADAMSRLMDDATERRRLGDRARAVTERFGLDRVARMWEELIGAAVREARRA